MVIADGLDDGAGVTVRGTVVRRPHERAVRSGAGDARSGEQQ